MTAAVGQDRATPRIFDPPTIKQGFNFGLGTASAGVLVGAVVAGAIKAIRAYQSAVAGAELGLACGGPPGAVIGATIGAMVGAVV